MIAMNDPEYFSDTTATFGDRLTAAREAAGLDQEAVARRMGVKLKTLRNWEEDLNEPRANKLQMVAGLLNVSIMWLLTGDGEAPEPVAAMPRDERDLLEALQDLRSESEAQVRRISELETQLRAVLRQPADE